MQKHFESRKQLQLLPERIRLAEETDATMQVYRSLWNIFENKEIPAMRIMVVGAGGSYPAAISISHSLRSEMITPYVDAVTPQTALRMLRDGDGCTDPDRQSKYNVVMGISYSGKTPDIKAVYGECLRKKIRFILFTGAETKTLEEDYPFVEIVSYFNDKDTKGKEKGMISMFSTLAPAMLFEDVVSNDPKARHYKEFEDYLKKGEKFVQNLNLSEIAKAIKKHPVIHVLYEWRTYAIAADIASKFMESGIANVILHEKKNFSHGVYTLLYKQDFGMVINLINFLDTIDYFHTSTDLTYSNNYDKELDALLAHLCSIKNAYYLRMGNAKYDTSDMIIKELSILPYLITAIGEELGVDISKPFKPGPFPEEAEALYRYKGEF